MSSSLTDAAADANGDAEADAKLQRLLGGPELAVLRGRLRRWFERSAEGDAPASVQLGELSAHEHEALALLSGRPGLAARSMRLDLGALDARLQAAGVAASLRQALERLDGPIVHRAALRAAAHSAWSAVLDAAGRDARLHAWLHTPTSTSLLKRLSRQDAAAAAALLASADAVLRRLPASGTPRAQLAAQTLGNAHALDAGQPTASVVLAAWRHAEALRPAALPGHDEVDEDAEPATGEAEPPAGETATPDERVRDVWARAGVLVNELARPVLVLNLPVQESSAPAGSPGEPAYLSLRQLLRKPPAWAVQRRPVFVCENPNLLAIAADRLGAACAPLVCTDGMPAAAQRTLLTQLAQAGAGLHVHADFDWPGLQIANHVVRTWQAKPWRMAASDYEAAALTAPHARRDLAESGIAADWDPLLAAAMQRCGLAIAEEAVADRLIEDLRTST